MCKKNFRIVAALTIVFFIVNIDLTACNWCDERHSNQKNITISSSVAAGLEEFVKIHKSTSTPSGILCPLAEEDFFKMLEKNDNETETIYFEFEQTADYGLDNFSQKTYGSVFYRKPENVKIDFYQTADVKKFSPIRTIVIDGKKFYDYNSDTNQCIIADWNKIKKGSNPDDLLLTFKGDNIKKLRERYDIKLIEISSDVVRISVMMSGKQSKLSIIPDAVFMNMDFDLSSGDTVVPLKTDFVSGGVRFVTSIKNFKKNPLLPDNLFKYRPPRGAEIIK